MVSRKNNSKTFYALSLAYQLGFLIIIPIGGFIFLGFWVDKSLGTSPIFLIIGLFSGIVVTIYEIYYLIIPLIKDEEKND